MFFYSSLYRAIANDVIELKVTDLLGLNHVIQRKASDGLFHEQPSFWASLTLFI